MEWITIAIDFVLHIDKHLDAMIQQYGLLTYVILFVIVFLETGIVFTPFLPGDSLIFAAGALSGRGTLNPHLVFLSLSIAAILGDTVNYWIGKFLGPKLLRGGDNSRFFKKAYLDKTHSYFERFGGSTIIIARFVPIVRTFAPFVAGVGAMTYSKFLFYNIIGALIWVGLCTYGGYYFGSLDFVKKNFSLVVLGIIFVSILPGIFEYVRHMRAAKAERAASVQADGDRA